ncbi:MAG TPA: hypothetical protein VNA04_15850 [Thermoanaerobaculia bacterium]|nr:hypothetical protein [Thermoanaerobaculia bacterium]
MWQPLSRVLEVLGRIRIRFAGLFRQDLTVGDSSAADAEGGQVWRSFLFAERLYDVWGPMPESPWTPFHCIPLFAAVDRVPRGRIGPTPPPGSTAANGKSPQSAILPDHARPGAAAPAWMSPKVLTILDLPGPACVEAAAWLIAASGCQPVCTFNNWPHAKGLLRPELILAELLRWASTISEARRRLTPASPPLWICASERLGARKGRPGEFDNRYFLEDAVLPGPGLLKAAGIHRVVYLTHDPAPAPVIDLDGYFFDLETAGIPVQIADIMEPALTLRPWVTRPPRRFSASSFKRSSAGGFGTTVPEPSSGGGG